jgi:outer membrane protein assembly factor BamB
MGTIKNFSKVFYNKISVNREKLFTSNYNTVISSNFLLLILVANLFILIACQDEITQSPLKPRGYQEYIPWSSLADSPWPIYQHDPQNTGRSQYKGPQSGIVAWDYDSVGIESGVVLGLNNAIIFQTGRPNFNIGGVFNIDPSGSINWYSSINEIAARTTPLVLKDGKIIVSSYTGGKIIAYDINGNELWDYNTGGYINNINMTVGLDGSIYFVDTSRTLYSLNSNGLLLWTLRIENTLFPYGLNSKLAFSPDGKTIYITGMNHALYAVNVQTQSLIWTYGNYFNISAPLIDNEGNVYLSGKPQSDQKTSVTKLSSNGDVLWIKYWGDDNEPYFYTPTLDKNGNIYLGYDSLYCFKYDGTLRWKINLFENVEGNILSSLSCDINDIIYVPVEVDLHKCKICAFNKEGKFVWQSAVLVGSVGDSPALCNGIMYLPTYRSEKLYSIQ